jgi:hypothetical protein
MLEKPVKHIFLRGIQPITHLRSTC